VTVVKMLAGLLIISLPRLLRTRRVLWGVCKGRIFLDEVRQQSA